MAIQVEALFVMQLVITYIASSDALVLGLSYFSGLVAFGASIGSTGNPAVAVGVVVIVVVAATLAVVVVVVD